LERIEPAPPAGIKPIERRTWPGSTDNPGDNTNLALTSFRACLNASTR